MTAAQGEPRTTAYSQASGNSDDYHQRCAGLIEPCATKDRDLFCVEFLTDSGVPCGTPQDKGEFLVAILEGKAASPSIEIDATSDMTITAEFEVGAPKSP